MALARFHPSTTRQILRSTRGIDAVPRITQHTETMKMLATMAVKSISVKLPPSSSTASASGGAGAPPPSAAASSPMVKGSTSLPPAPGVSSVVILASTSIVALIAASTNEGMPLSALSALLAPGLGLGSTEVDMAMVAAVPQAMGAPEWRTLSRKLTITREASL